VLELREASAHLCDFRELLGVLAERNAAVGVRENVPALVRRIAVLDGGDDRARAERAEVGQRPLRPGAG
jgi:hypothetical protein